MRQSWLAVLAAIVSGSAQAQVGSVEQAAQQAALAAAAAATGTTAPVTAPARPGIADIDPARLPPDGQRAFQLRAAALQMTALPPESYPQVELRADNKVKRKPKGCSPQKHVVGLQWAPGSWTGIMRYVGEAVDCVPQGVGTVTWSDGRVWTGEVADVVTAVRPQQQGDYMLPMPRGLGIMTPLDPKMSITIARARARAAGDPPICTNCVLLNSFGSNATPNEVYPYIEPLIVFDATNPRNFAVGLDDQGTGTGSLHAADGTIFAGEFVGARPKPGAIVTRTSPDGTTVKATFEGWLFKPNSPVVVTYPNGDVWEGSNAAFTNDNPTGSVYFSGQVDLQLVNGGPAYGLPAGQYRSYHELRNGKVVSIIEAPIGDTLFNGGPQPEGCKSPTFLPPNFVTFWPLCRPDGKADASGRPADVVTRSYSKDLRQILFEYFGSEEYRFHLTTRDASGRIVSFLQANGVVTDPVFGPVGKAHFENVAGGFTGEFVGLVPDGPGTCYVRAEKVEEPCFYVNGARTDEIHQARQDAKIAARAAKREADALAAQQAEEQRLLQQAADEQRKAREAAESAALNDRFTPKRYDDDDAPQGNPILDVLNDLSGKFRAAAVENQQGWDRVNEINAAQQRAADARAAARQAENARVAQANAAAAEQRAAQARNAQAITAAEIQRRQAEAQARVADARQRAIAEQQAAAQTQAPTLSRASGSSASPIAGTSSPAVQRGNGAGEQRRYYPEEVVYCWDPPGGPYGPDKRLKVTCGRNFGAEGGGGYASDQAFIGTVSDCAGRPVGSATIPPGLSARAYGCGWGAGAAQSREDAARRVRVAGAQIFTCLGIRPRCSATE